MGDGGMIELVARELAKLDAVDPDDTSGPEYGGGRYLHGSPAWTQNTDIARLLILAMREPTEEMTDAVYKADLDINFGYWGDGAPSGADAVWRVMIDAALKSP